MVLLLALAGCSSTVVDLSSPDGSGTDYEQDAVYVLRNDRYLDMPQGTPTPAPVIIAVPNSYLPGMAPSTIEEYRANPGRWPRIQGVLPAGTRVRLVGVERHGYPGLEDWFEVSGVIESGEFRGREVNLGFVSSRASGSRIPRVNPEELRREVPDSAVP